MPPRAIHPEEKLRKRASILDAAQDLWTTHTDRLSSMDALAQASGVAKGTLYLYFRSKEEVLLALHERDMEQFFGRVIERAQQAEPMKAQDLSKLVIESIQNSPTFMPLAALCLGLMERHIPVELGVAFKLRITEQIDKAVLAALRQHFPTISCETMMQCYALMLGLWQLIKQNPVHQHLVTQGIETNCKIPVTEEQFLQFLGNSLSTLLIGLLAQAHPEHSL